MSKKSFVPKLSYVCPQDWEAMKGDEKRRFCERCQLHVHNFSAMTPAEQRSVLPKGGGRICVAYRSADTLVVRPGIWLLLQRLLLRPWRAVVALVAILLPSVSASAATSHRQARPKYAAVVDHKETCDFKGDVLMPEPLWKRVLFFWRR